MTVADRIRLKREELNISQEELAKMIGNKDKSTISKIEKSGDKITMKNIKRIADALGVSSQYLLGWEDELSEIRKKILRLQFDYEEAKSAGNTELLKHIEEEQEYMSLVYSEKYNNMLKYKFEYDNPEAEYLFTSPTTPISKEEMRRTANETPLSPEARDFIETYQNAPEEVKQAIRALLKFSK